ncbi:hypothetical protein AB1N83_012782 [Pleurotus pulmonarius]
MSPSRPTPTSSSLVVTRCSSNSRHSLVALQLPCHVLTHSASTLHSPNLVINLPQPRSNTAALLPHGRIYHHTSAVQMSTTHIPCQHPYLWSLTPTHPPPSVATPPTYPTSLQLYPTPQRPEHRTPSTTPANPVDAAENATKRKLRRETRGTKRGEWTSSRSLCHRSWPDCSELGLGRMGERAQAETTRGRDMAPNDENANVDTRGQTRRDANESGKSETKGNLKQNEGRRGCANSQTGVWSPGTPPDGRYTRYTPYEAGCDAYSRRQRRRGHVGTTT